MDKKNVAQLTFGFVLIIGIVNLFADFTYEGGRSINGAFLSSLGASAVAVGFIAGFGELLGYALRSIAGFFADKTHKYWIFAFVGYAINMLAVPALALAGNWPVACVLIIAERTGRAIRKPAVEAMLSFAGKEMGSGWVFGLNEFLDQFGATLGPLIVAWVLFAKKSYKYGYGILLISALLCLAMLAAARLFFPKPQDLDKKEAVGLETKGLTNSYWLYLVGGALIAAGFADFALIAFHFDKTNNVPMHWIPIFYAAAMAVGGISSLIFGRLLDKIGPKVMLIAFFLGAFFAPFVFLGKFVLSTIGMILWGIGLGAQESLLKAMLANVISRDKRSTAFGVFDTGFGIAWFLGSAIMGILYVKSIAALIIFSVVLQIAALPIFIIAINKQSQQMSQQKSRKLLTISKKMLKIFFSLIGIGISIGGFLFVVYPRLSISPGESLDPYEPFSTPFVIKNDGYLPLFNVNYSVTINKMENINHNLQFEDVKTTVNSIKSIPKLSPNKSTAIFIDKNISVPPKFIKYAEIDINVTYKPYIIPYTFTENVRFKMATKTNNEYFWLPYYSGQ